MAEANNQSSNILVACQSVEETKHIQSLSLYAVSVQSKIQSVISHCTSAVFK